MGEISVEHHFPKNKHITLQALWPLLPCPRNEEECLWWVHKVITPPRVGQTVNRQNLCGSLQEIRNPTCSFIRYLELNCVNLEENEIVPLVQSKKFNSTKVIVLSKADSKKSTQQSKPFSFLVFCYTSLTWILGK